MANVIIRPSWYLSERQVTPEREWMHRRRFVATLGLAGMGWMGGLARMDGAQKQGYPYPRNKSFEATVPLTDETVAGTYNNFYEFSLDKKKVKELVGTLVTDPWPIEIRGLVEQPMTIDVAELVATMPMEERVYRFRCVEAWAMVVPWTGFPLSKLLEKVRPKPEAKFVRFITFNRPEQAPGMARMKHYPWPYFEGLRMDEAMHPLTLLATGIYGKPMPKQHGAPIRVVVPWKYGYKSAKSIVTIELVSEQPKTFWETLAPDEYPFESNVDPKVPHPRWSQATERMIDTGDRVRTLPFNGYGETVARLYSKS